MTNKCTEVHVTQCKPPTSSTNTAMAHSQAYISCASLCLPPLCLLRYVPSSIVAPWKHLWSSLATPVPNILTRTDPHPPRTAVSVSFLVTTTCWRRGPSWAFHPTWQSWPPSESKLVDQRKDIFPNREPKVRMRPGVFKCKLCLRGYGKKTFCRQHHYRESLCHFFVARLLCHEGMPWGWSSRLQWQLHIPRIIGSLQKTENFPPLFWTSLQGVCPSQHEGKVHPSDQC